MEIRTLYRIINNGKVTVTPIKPNHNDYTQTYRVIADDGMVLTDGENTYSCVDTDEPSKYMEISEMSDSDYAEAGKILLGVSE